jgi:curved DNA-binding protein CbpA
MIKDPKRYYSILGLSQKADTAAIKAAFRRRAMELHPDRNTSPDADRDNANQSPAGDRI